MANRLRGNEQAQPDELGSDPGQVGPDSAGQSGDPQSLSSIESASDESVQELADTEQTLEAEVVEGVEDAGDHPERPVHTHLDYGRPEDIPPRRAAEYSDDRANGGGNVLVFNNDASRVDVEDLVDQDTLDRS